MSLDQKKRMNTGNGDMYDSQGDIGNIIDLLNGLKSNISFETRVSLGLEEGMSIVDKFGSNPDVDASTTPENIWTKGGIYTWGDNNGSEVYISSSNVSDDQTIETTVLTVDNDGDWNEEVFEVELNGTTKTIITTPSGNGVVRAFRMENVSSGELQGEVHLYYDDAVIDGVPQTQSKILSHILNGGQSRQLNYTIPSGYWGFLWRGESGCTKTGGTDEMDFSYQSRRIDRTFITKKTFGVMTTGSSFYQDLRPFPDIIPSKTDLCIMCENVSANNLGAWGTFHILLISDERFQEFQNVV